MLCTGHLLLKNLPHHIPQWPLWPPWYYCCLCFPFFFHGSYLVWCLECFIASTNNSFRMFCNCSFVASSVLAMSTAWSSVIMSRTCRGTVPDTSPSLSTAGSQRLDWWFCFRTAWLGTSDKLCVSVYRDLTCECFVIAEASWRFLPCGFLTRTGRLPYIFHIYSSFAGLGNTWSTSVVRKHSRARSQFLSSVW